MDLTRGPAREILDAAEVRRLRPGGTLIVDSRRSRPRYFDGRFLAARDLTREQNYFLQRQADLSRATGTGVVHGLQVARGPGNRTIRVSPGHGITPGGESVILQRSLTLDVTDIPLIQRLNVAFRLSRIPAEPVRSLTGIFIVALRPVEFTAVETASYPTSIEGPRSVEDGEIIEAAAITLIPYPDSGLREEMDLRRSRAALDIFLNGSTQGIPERALPLAMIGLDRNGVEWIDTWLVRREVTTETELPTLGFSPSAVRHAHLLQYSDQLSDVISERTRLNRGLRFAASEHFAALPPAGRMPSACIDPNDFTQIFFPPTVDVDLSVIPEDEVPALVEESSRLPALDLTSTTEELDSTAFVALIPVARQSWVRLRNRLTTVTRVLRPAVPGLLAQHKPLERLMLLRLPRFPVPTPPPTTDDVWREALAAAPFLWFARRRALPYRQDITGIPVLLPSDEAGEEDRIRGVFRGLNLEDRLNAVLARAPLTSRGSVLDLFSSARLRNSEPLTRAALAELEAQPEINRAAVMNISDRFANPQTGTGIDRAITMDSTVSTLLPRIAEAGAVPEFDAAIRRLPPAERERLIGDIRTMAAQPDTDSAAIRNLIISRGGVLRR